MLQEEESAPGLQNPPDLGEHPLKVWNRAKNQGGKYGIHGLIGEGELFGNSLDQVRGTAPGLSLPKEVPVHEWVRLDPKDSQVVGKVLEVGPGPGSDLDQCARKARQKMSLSTFHEGGVVTPLPVP